MLAPLVIILQVLWSLYVVNINIFISLPQVLITILPDLIRLLTLHKLGDGFVIICFD
jgi:hypothetical protein